MQKNNLEGRINANDAMTEKNKDDIAANCEMVKNFKTEMDERVSELKNWYSEKQQRQFDDFILKIDGELTRRNRLRTETFNKFAEQDGIMARILKQVDAFRLKQHAMISTVTKLSYVQDIQCALNI